MPDPTELTAESSDREGKDVRLELGGTEIHLNERQVKTLINTLRLNVEHIQYLREVPSE